jgi:myo-inositol 2-dehydrogenase/D-chiro-inositol 1-dehydrogenase
MAREAELHVGLVGLGRIGAFHAETLRALEGVATLTLADADPARAAALAAKLAAGTAATPEGLVESVDALVIATPSPSHAPLLRLAADVGIPAFCEKPVALDARTLDSVIADVERSGILVQVGFQRRFDTGYRTARDAVVSGAVGKVLVLRAATHDPSPPPEEYIADSGGIFRDLHIHDFDAIRFVTGEEIVEVYADGAVLESPWFERHDDVDTAVAAMRLEGGALAILSGARHDPLGYDVRLEVFGSADSIVVGVDDRSPLRSVEPGSRAPDAGYRSFLDRFQHAYRAELAAFVDAVRAGGPSPCSLREARAALVVAHAADRSRRERRPVSIQEAAGAEAATGVRIEHSKVNPTKEPSPTMKQSTSSRRSRRSSE